MRRFSTPLASTGIKTLRIFASLSREQSERERRRSRRRRGPPEEARLATRFVTSHCHQALMGVAHASVAATPASGSIQRALAHPQRESWEAPIFEPHFEWPLPAQGRPHTPIAFSTPKAPRVGGVLSQAAALLRAAMASAIASVRRAMSACSSSTIFPLS